MANSYEDRILELLIEAEERETLRYPEASREKAVALVAELKAAGWTQTRISEELDISWATLGRWCEEANSESDEESLDSFRPVEVVGGQQAAEDDPVALISPSGWRIEGLTVAEAVEAARRIG